MERVPAAGLATMPLWAITESLGEEGLRARFVLEICRFDPADRRRLAAALCLATDLHRHDQRIREPYVNHLLRVAIRIMSHYEVRDVDTVVASVLHDAVEDHAPQLADQGAGGDAEAGAGAGAGGDVTGAALRTMQRQFGQRVATLVESVTNPPFDPLRDTNTQYCDHLLANLDRNPWARVIKASDFTDNGVGVIHITGQKARRAAEKYRPLVPILRELVSRSDTPLSDWVKRHIFGQLDLAEERFNDILCVAPPLSWSDPVLESTD
ncbi:MAG: HD domain-containing protein [Micromonosporaceae bacterium]|nr:HD domain-containing protein [Micromonosporaceae bacterium]